MVLAGLRGPGTGARSRTHRSRPGARAGRHRHAARQRHRLEPAAPSLERPSSPRKREPTSAGPTTTNESGYYIFSSLQNGTYSVDAELQGFKKIVRQNVKVDVNTTIRVDLKLEVGQMTEAVTVSAETPGAADGPHRYRPHHRVEDGQRDAADLQPQLPGPARHRAGRDASAPGSLGVLQLAGFAVDRSQRAVRAWRTTR